jgi:hypothetical protein
MRSSGHGGRVPRAVRSPADTRTGGRPALFGVAHVVLLFAGSAAVAGTRGAGRHSLHASVEDVAAYVGEASLGRVWVGEYLAVLAYVLFVPFAAYLATAVAGARPWLAATARGTAWLYVGLSLAAVALLVPALHRELEPVQAAAFLDLRTALLALSFVGLAAWLVTVGAAAAAARTLPRWLALAAVAIGLLQLLATPFAAYSQEVTGLPTFAALLWIVVAAIALARRGGAGSEPARTG